MRKLKITVAIVAISLASMMSAHAQWKNNADTLNLSRWEPHLSASTGFIGTSFGDNRLYTSVAPSLSFRPSDRWTLNAGFRITTDMGLNPNYTLSTPTRSLAPYRHRNGGTGLVSAHIAAQYQVSDNLWLAAAIYHLGGTYAPVYGFGNGEVFDVSATAFSAAATYRFKNDSFLHFSVSYVRDEQGTLPFLWHDAWMHGGYGAWGMYHIGNPYSQMLFGGYY